MAEASHLRAARGVAFWAAFACGLLGSSQAPGFDTPEHVWISNRAMCFALELRRLEPARSDADCADASPDSVLRCLAADHLASHVSYGELVAYPDYVSRPDALVAPGREGMRRISSAQVRDKVAPGSWGYWALTEMLRNSHHFRQEALTGYREGHRRALDAARSRGDGTGLAEALALNAYADHFLQDFFAPGHMTEEALGKSFMGNARVHDRDNRQGRKFAIRERAWSRLLKRVFSDHWKEEDATRTVRRCFQADAVGPSTFESLQDELSQGRTIHLVGDGDLYSKRQNRSLAGSQEQALLIALATAGSILEVIETWQQGASGPPSCIGSEDDPIGCDLESDDFAVDPPPIEGKQSFASIPLGFYVTEPPRLGWPNLGASVELQTSNTRSRISVTGEVIFPVGSLGDGGVELVAGYSYVGRTNNRYRGHGPDARLQLAFKELGFLVAADVGYRFYQGYGRSVSNPRGGLRAGVGYGPFTGFLAYSIDRKLTKRGPRWDYATWGLGLSMNLSGEYLWRLARQCGR